MLQAALAHLSGGGWQVWWDDRACFLLPAGGALIVIKYCGTCAQTDTTITHVTSECNLIVHVRVMVTSCLLVWKNMKTQSYLPGVIKVCFVSISRISHTAMNIWQKLRVLWQNCTLFRLLHWTFIKIRTFVVPEPLYKHLFAPSLMHIWQI